MAGKQAALAVLGRSKAEGDGWDDEDDMEETIDEEGSRARCPSNGRLVSCKEFREGKAVQTKSGVDAAAAEQLAGFKKRRLQSRMLTENALAEQQLESQTGAIKSQPLMVAFVRARTNKPVKVREGGCAQGPGPLPAYSLRQKPLAIQLALEPDGYQAWLQTQTTAPAPVPAQARRRV